jgi:hypothetical protein
MTDHGKQPGSNPIGRRLAIAIAIVCFLVALGFNFLTPERGDIRSVLFIIVGLIVIATGFLGKRPPNSQ